MSEDKQKDQNPDNAADQNQADAKPKSKLMKYIIFGVAGLVVIFGIAFGVAIMLKDSAKADSGPSAAVEQTEAQQDNSSKDAKNQAVANHDETAAEKAADKDNPELEGVDQNAIEKIVDNLKFLDYKPNDSEIATNNGMSIEDSLEQVSWVEKEKAAISKRKKELDQREKALNKQEQAINAKILRIEQAESNRISQLAKLYDGMDSRAVAKLMMNLDDNTVVSILPRMKSKNAALVLQLLPSQRAALLSKKMITIADK